MENLFHETIRVHVPTKSIRVPTDSGKSEEMTRLFQTGNFTICQNISSQSGKMKCKKYEFEH